MSLRPSVDEYFIAQALLCSTRGTCYRRLCGCILVDRNNHVLASGYNGPPRGSSHCISFPCAGAKAPPGEGLERCEAVHAEANAIMQCRDTQKIVTAYCTNSPCVWCIGLLMNTSCSRILFAEEYAHDTESKRRWHSRGETYIWRKIEIKNDVLAKVADAVRLVQLPKNMETNN